MGQYWVYIMPNRSYTLCAGVMNDLYRRVCEHKQKLARGFTAKHNIGTPGYYEIAGHVQSAIRGEKQVKGWTRARKIAPIESVNPQGRDLSDG